MFSFHFEDIDDYEAAYGVRIIHLGRDLRCVCVCESLMCWCVLVFSCRVCVCVRSHPDSFGDLGAGETAPGLASCVGGVKANV